jgi:TetR/AcrR family transcriptional regulator
MRRDTLSTRTWKKSSTRDPKRTKERILAAALKEFSDKGFTGARVDAITRSAAINKRMLYHYFGSKEGLFREVVRQKLAQRAAWLAASPMNPIELLPYWFDLASKDLQWIRLLQWEALQLSQKKLVDEDKRREAVARGVDKLRHRQELGLMSAELDPRHVLLSHMSLTMFPLAFPQLTRLIMGCSASDQRFIRERLDFLRRLAGVLYQNQNIHIPAKNN